LRSFSRFIDTNLRSLKTSIMVCFQTLGNPITHKKDRFCRPFKIHFIAVMIERNAETNNLWSFALHVFCHILDALFHLFSIVTNDEESLLLRVKVVSLVRIQKALSML